MKMKGQGSLEYLIIIAAVLAIAAIVVLFLTGAFTGARVTGDASKCKTAASQCATELATSTGATCSYCEGVCEGVASSNTNLYADGEAACKAGQPLYIVTA
ncbi:MAG: class III signal peptide-containing protein [archaeon]